MAFEWDFEAYWRDFGIKTDPAVIGLAFKECAEKAVTAACLFYNSKRVKVRTVSPKHDDQYTDDAKLRRRWGVIGEIIANHDAHGFCYDVLHDDGSVGTYDPDELEVVSLYETQQVGRDS